jgi:hypothetical protein
VGVDLVVLSRQQTQLVLEEVVLAVFEQVLVTQLHQVHHIQLQ